MGGMMTELISIKEAARLSGYDIQHLRRLMRQGKVKGEKVGDFLWMVDRRSLQDYLRTMKALGDQKFNPHRVD
jgi:hypothetical protein